MHALALALGVGLATLGGLGCSNRLFLHPTKKAIEIAATRVDIVGTRWPIRGRHIEGWYREHGTEGRAPALYVLAFTGNGGRAEHELSAVEDLLAGWPPVPDTADPAQPDAPRGVGVLAVNYPGFGGSEGPATLRRLGAAALDAYAHLARRAQGTPIVVYGMSMGTTAALHVARSSPDPAPAGLVLDRGPDVPGIVLGRFGWWNLWLLAGPVAASLPRATRSVANARHIDDIPAVFVLGTEDRLVRPRNGYRVARTYAGPKRVVWLSVGHGAWIYGPSHPGIGSGLRWLGAQIDAARAGAPRDPPSR